MWHCCITLTVQGYEKALNRNKDKWKLQNKIMKLMNWKPFIYVDVWRRLIVMHSTNGIHVYRVFLPMFRDISTWILYYDLNDRKIKLFTLFLACVWAKWRSNVKHPSKLFWCICSSLLIVSFRCCMFAD